MPKMTFQWFFDMSTIKDTMQKITVFAGGTNIVRRLSPQFCAYKHFKLGKIKLSMSPASSLPIDPTGLSYEAGENTVDPRDQLTPGLVRITNGECVGPIPDNLTAEALHKFYNQMILDRRWYKFSMQGGLKKSAVPLFWSVGMTHQIPFPSMYENLPCKFPDDTIGSGAYKEEIVDDGISSPIVKQTVAPGNANHFAMVQTGNNVKLGWLPTDEFVYTDGKNIASVADVPAVSCFTVLLPPAHKTKYYFRCYVTETVYFKDAVTNYFGVEDEYGAFQSLDRFVAPAPIKQQMPGTTGNQPTEPVFKLNQYTYGD